MSVILFIITFIFLLFFLVLVIFGRFISGIFRIFRGNKSRQGGGYENTRNKYYQNQNSQNETKGDSGKVFSKDEGEYVSYEEIE